MLYTYQTGEVEFLRVKNPFSCILPNFLLFFGIFFVNHGKFLLIYEKFFAKKSCSSSIR